MVLNVADTYHTATSKWRESIVDLRFINIIFSLKFFFNVYLFLRKTETSRGRSEKEGDIESGAGSRIQMVNTEPDTGPESTNHEIMT